MTPPRLTQGSRHGTHCECHPGIPQCRVVTLRMPPRDTTMQTRHTANATQGYHNADSSHCECHPGIRQCRVVTLRMPPVNARMQRGHRDTTPASVVPSCPATSTALSTFTPGAREGHESREGHERGACPRHTRNMSKVRVRYIRGASEVHARITRKVCEMIRRKLHITSAGEV